MAEGILLSFLLLLCLYSTDLSYPCDLGSDCNRVITSLLVLDHGSFSLSVLDASLLLAYRCLSHVELGAVEIVLRHLTVVVEDGKLVMLSRLDVGLLVAPKSRTLSIVMSTLNALCEVGPRHPDRLSGHRAPQKLTVEQLLVIGVLLLSNCIDSIKVAHLLDRTGAPLLVISKR